MSGDFRVRITVRGYELDTQGHVNQAVYLQYAEHARWECLRAAGVSQERLLATRVGPVALETTIRYRSELRGGDELDVTCAFVWSEGKTFRVVQELRRVDGTLSAELIGVAGLLDLDERKLLSAPGEHFRSLATAPELLGLA
ncbi:acyl-CoA thioesterase [Micromonospora sp. NPDC049679]|uniref:acyl-CoA thioesterase n=1 Tax=Micromonospora sp. NPDC049679 TaxID=3155920 RepID=UPI00340A5D5A